ncbi:single-stranded-DNA-specific exonuclease RecJ [Irregularibacter muris]|uniref:Single-stranded-DNA-specific exonuclease RecJ n=1 Tax=Irregularibacter muris TaxID=1796619 RepID=A0AAE3HCM9_9FIRM|nr:single-stranded-DNA-specific exonuclease RecJ [Irregularibacter muris]MCR1897745.1 single-stranded-DNA-specific exonuclease RecJ [Irregularibacter muris]
MDKIWNIIGSREKGQSLVENILVAKGISDPEERKEFLSDKPQKTYNPLSIKNMDKAVEKIIEHLDKKSKVIIFGDYDVDGVTSTALLVEFFNTFTDKIDYYIPNRFSEGYGLNKEALLYIKEEMQGELVITVDNGVSCYEEIKYAQEIGLDIIVTDHHNPPEKLPSCILVNVKQEGDSYPFKELCGCGVAFKLAQALQRALSLPKNVLSHALDLVTLATISDLVPLIDENRTMVKYGLKIINSNKRLGLSVLREIAGLKNKEINAGRIGFTIGPCFNAAGRLEDAKLGVQLLLEKNKVKAQEIAIKLHGLNSERQRIQNEGEKICKEMVEQKYLDSDFLVLRVDKVSEGVIGIIAGKIKELFYKPTLVVTKGEEGYLKGSGRSIRGINIYEEMKKVSDLFIGFGGHEMACGFSIEEDKLEELRKRLNDRARAIKEKAPDVFVPKVDIITEMQAQELNVELVKEISKLEPYGMGNPKPLFILRDIQVNSSWTKACGSDKTHLKFSGKKDEIFLSGIGFSLASRYQHLGMPNILDAAFCVEINEYNGKITPQMVIEDIRVG